MAIVHLKRERRETDHRAEPLCNFRGFVWERLTSDPEKVTCSMCLLRMAVRQTIEEAERVEKL
jgi:hypothetical protein